jgi:hypothetical protein
MKTTALLAAGALLFVAPPTPRPLPFPATVALLDALPGSGAQAAILRRAQPRADVILLARSSATVENLAAALALLADLRAPDEPAVTRDAMLLVKSSRLDRPLSVVQRMRLEGHLARLRLARSRNIDGVGSAPAIDVNVRARSGTR